MGNGQGGLYANDVYEIVSNLEISTAKGKATFLYSYNIETIVLILKLIHSFF